MKYGRTSKLSCCVCKICIFIFPGFCQGTHLFIKSLKNALLMIRAFWKDGSLLTRFTLRTHDDDRSVSGSSTWKELFLHYKILRKNQISVYQHIVHKNLRFLGEIYLALSLRQLPGILQKGSWVASQSIMLYPPYSFSTHIFTHLTTFLHNFAYIPPFLFFGQFLDNS